MSQEAVEIVRAHIEAYRRDDVPGALAFLDTNVVVEVGVIKAFMATRRWFKRVERTFAGLYHLLGGKIVRITRFATEQDALQAAGLSE